MLIYGLMILCAAALVIGIYSCDTSEKEPWWAILLAVVVGFTAMWIIGMADNFALRCLEIPSHQIATKAATIALIEEGGKLLTILFLAQVLLRHQFSEPMDGVIYGQLAGLGMGLEESLLYLSINPPTIQTLGMEIVRLFAHSLMAALIGYAIGAGIQPKGQRHHQPRLILLCLALSTTMHFGWDVIAYARNDHLLAHILPMWLMLIMMIVWRWFCSLAQDESKMLLASQPSML
jgi:RsiW-degrading membrane proteinase PrsW (M82 family)